MDMTTYVMLGLGEALMLSLFGLTAALLYARKLKALLAKTKKANNAKLLDEPPAAELQEPVEEPAALSYGDYIDQQIRELRRYHKSLKGGQDIALDLDSAVAVERRMASMRHVMLVAEREATHTNETNWPELITRYRQLMRFFDDSLSPKLEAELAMLKQDLQSSHTKVMELEKYKALYFDLEKNWHESKNQADDYFDQLKTSVETEQGDEALMALLDNYRGSFNPMADMFEAGQPLPVTLEAAGKEIDSLRRMAAEQCRMIEQLKIQVAETSDSNAKVAIIKGLEKQLVQQQRMTQESETCIQLIEGELNGAFKEIQSLKEQVKETVAMRAKIAELNEELEVKVLMIGHLKDSQKAPSLQAHDGDDERVAAANLKIQVLSKELALLQQRNKALEASSSS
jgi:hypothetical protein